jgi:hypothetical protein
MNARDAIRQVIEFGHMVVRLYIDDLCDADLLVRSVPNANHIAWQLGHLIDSTNHILAAIGKPGFLVPAGFETLHTRDTAGIDDPAKFCKKAEYVKLMDQAKAATLAGLDSTPENTFDQPGPESLQRVAPTVGSVLMLLGTHWLMHAGQFVPIRRKLGKVAMF